MRRPTNLAAEIPPSLKRADELLTLYGRWAMDRRRLQRCGSAEGHYKAPANDDDRKPGEKLMPMQEALAVHRALLRVPDRERVVLHVLYVPKRLSPMAQLRIMRIPARLCQERHLMGLRMFERLYAAAQHA